MTKKVNLNSFGRNKLSNHGCSTCADVAVPVKVIEIHDNEAVVEDRSGVRTNVAIDFVPDIKKGEILLVHMGVALGRALEVQT
ncbi:hydrogenase expression/formation protein HypC [Caldalkalibacillus uzonensis]|uniref:Hydrogenase expression/formation protein HypC n=1 Tax=Caldalkalibacillus uzonensis TaxID=353224 RepID=A0ABU0CXI6_9BACI|nr:HypC/HybG/HupF family hydrogenase formation chaperone [Caldalkalibacillus uzonensis]MDQ0340939.1 hydrogenase expression/formation protein HypC [Caldalkalibacillus uzonensis]